MAHRIFLLHGIGEHKKDWADPIIKQLTTQYSEYAVARDMPFDKHFKFIPISYNDIFSDYLAQLKKNSNNLEKWTNLVSPISNKFVKKMVDIAASEPGDGFVVTYIGDVLLYMLTNIREVVKLRVIKEINEALKDSASDGWSFISHSMGTRVMTDSLQAMFTDSTLDTSAIGKARVVMTVANVSFLLQQLSDAVGISKEGDVYHNQVYPSSKSTEGVCRYFINAAHDLDPFLLLHPFEPPVDFGGPSGRVFDRGLYNDVRLRPRDLTGNNPHDFQHYLRHPDVHQALFQALIDPKGDSIFSEAELIREREDYHDETLVGAALDKVRTGLEKLKQKDFSNLDKLIEIWKQFGQTL